MNPEELLRKAWAEAGYPPPAGPLVAMFGQVAAAVFAAFDEGEEDFIAAGWQEAGQDFPFATGHPRYVEMTAAYRRLARPN